MHTKFSQKPSKKVAVQRRKHGCDGVIKMDINLI
jgi:hypothetical protein